MTAKLYSSPVLTLTASASIHDALVLMKTNFVKRVVIVRDKRPVGILTERDVNRFLEKDTTKRSLSEIPIREAMRKDLITIVSDLEDFLHQCATRMVTFKIGSIIVTDENGDLAGIVTQTDIADVFAAKYSGRYRVRDYMSEKTVTCRSSDQLKYALEILNKNDVSRLIVTDNAGHVRGLVTTNTFLRRSEYFKRADGLARDYLLEKSKYSLTVDSLLEKEIIVVEPDYDLASAAQLMIKNKISGVPVISHDTLVGVVTKFDIVRAFCDVPVHKTVLEKYRAPT
ncbi:MAG TPA: CBS domain-containing protein [Candidatus Nitrosotenuis sp.]|nr:CBS domain-containing protein [Candidatus Nitrosotenuis sp.]